METRFRTLAILWLLLALTCCAGASAAGGVDAREQAIIAAVKLANGLEAEYWADPDAYPTWEALYAHYRKGYSAAIAERMTEYSLLEGGDAATWIPGEVHVAGFDGDSAVAWFRTPPEFGEHGSWGFEPFMVVRLRREGARWVIYWATDSATPPPAP
jgi:hypothetical protein